MKVLVAVSFVTFIAAYFTKSSLSAYPSVFFKPFDNQTSPVNATFGNATRVEKANNVTYKVNCLHGNGSFGSALDVGNTSKLMKLMYVQPNITTHQTPAECFVIFFYSPSCPFSCMAAPHFNALPRAFPDMRMAAIDTSTRYNFNAQFGIIGVPSLLLFHNGRPASRFNHTSEYNLESFAKFITKNTGFQPVGKLFVTSADFAGPISSVPLKTTDYFLILSWVFIALCAFYFFYHSSMCQWLVDSVRSAWIEAEAHNHSD